MPHQDQTQFTVRISFNSEASRDNFMSKAVREEDFDYLLDRDDSVLIPNDAPESLIRIAQESGGYQGYFSGQVIEDNFAPSMYKADRVSQADRALDDIRGRLYRLS